MKIQDGLYRKIGQLIALAVLMLILSVWSKHAPELVLAQEGNEVEPQVVGGKPADSGEYPWMAAITAGEEFCGGSLIAPGWVLTAAHCVYDDNGVILNSADIDVVLGINFLQGSGSKGQRIDVAQIIPHPDYKVTQHSDIEVHESDLALLRLARPAVLGPTVNTIGLLGPENGHLTDPSTLAVVTGWGLTTEEGSLSDILLELTLPIISNQVCNEPQSYNGRITDNMLCAGFVDGRKDSCQGDSGGPLIVPDDRGRFLQAGIVSFGKGCARPKLYGVYTRVSQFKGWIEAQLESPPLETGSLIGVIYNAKKGVWYRLAGATITACTGQTTFTNSRGLYWFNNLPVGYCRITASKSGYQTRSRTGWVVANTLRWNSIGLWPAWVHSAAEEGDTTVGPDEAMSESDTINILDLAFIASSYGASDGEADLNSDGVVDILDLSIIGAAYGQSEPVSDPQ